MSAASDAGTPRRDLLPGLAAAPGHMFWRASARVDQAMAEVLPAGVDVHGYAALLALDDGSPRSQQWLADTVGVSRTTMAKVAADLAARGLVERTRNPQDRRSYALTITDEGSETAGAWRPHVRAAKEALLDGFTPAERAELHRMLFTVAEPVLADRLLPDLPASTGFLIARLHAHLHAQVMAALRDLDLEPRHLGTLVVLTTVGPVPQAELARHLGVSGPSVVEIADHLERRGVLERRRLDSDRRTQILHLLPGTEDLVAEAHARGLAATMRTLAPLSEAELSRLLILLARLVTGA